MSRSTTFPGEYRGRAQDRVVSYQSWGKQVSPRHDLKNHSPDGFAWGYGGSGPAQLALGLICHAIHVVTRDQQEQALALYQSFKEQVIQHLPQDKDWRLVRADVIRWVNAVQARHTDLGRNWEGWGDSAEIARPLAQRMLETIAIPAEVTDVA